MNGDGSASDRLRASRGGREENRTAMDDLIAMVRTRREITLREIDMMAAGVLQVLTNGKDTTPWSLADARVRLAELDRLLGQYEKAAR
jgi:hypothetical protein